MMSTLSSMGRSASGAAFLLGAIAITAANAPVKADTMTCLQVRDIDHTKVLNDHEILFYLNGHKVWLNTLPNKCGALRNDEGFIHVTRDEQYCDNLETIKVRPTGETCLLGKFTPYEKPAS